MADHVFEKPDGRCVECGVHAKDAHRVPCVRTVGVTKATSKPKTLKTRPAAGRGGTRPGTNPARYRRSTRRSSRR
jgi:hypothetical protein